MKIGDLVWVWDYFQEGQRELGEVVRLFEKDECSPLVVRGICQNSRNYLYTKFYLDIERLFLFESVIVEGVVIHHATPKNKTT